MQNNIEDFGGEFGDLPNDKYKKFFARFSEIEILPINEWKPLHIISYFCKKYKEAYNVAYQFKFNSPSPSKCFEIFQIKKLSQIMTSDPTLLKEYIDWAFKTKVQEAKRKLTSISFLTKEETVQWYKLNVLLAAPKIDRTTKLTDLYLEILAPYNINNYGDLTFFYHANKQSPEIVKVFNQMSKMGFNFALLEKIV